jgi:hypothetical protein
MEILKACSCQAFGLLASYHLPLLARGQWEAALISKAICHTSRNKIC